MAKLKAIPPLVASALLLFCATFSAHSDQYYLVTNKSVTEGPFALVCVTVEEGEQIIESGIFSRSKWVSGLAMSARNAAGQFTSHGFSILVSAGCLSELEGELYRQVADKTIIAIEE